MTIEIRAGESSYAGSARNGITTKSYGAWSGSYVFTGSSRGTYAGSGWGSDVKKLRGLNGQTFKFSCPAGGKLSTIWGTGVYTDDSSVCVAAVHAGLITLARGGTVTVRVQAGLSSYRGSTSRGVTSRGYGAWSGSYTFVR